ncbi:MAG: N-acetylglucosamine-1-phosphate uridyltransferase [Ruminococcus sp.]|uniref:DUF6055 domain-containing protein n=1 Tax=Ruminococcus sp. TaxID=41978 RepID=UPI0025DC8ABA|nr:DUF6055 domain-containing protein [Ruminococcus sp.]MCR4793749.1 N-acetylglucosamine-1-phosphate uridyltransferase [Ruminococcus sp.]
MVFKRLLAAAASFLLVGSTVRFPSTTVVAAGTGEEEYLCRDYHDFSGDQHYMDKYNTATSQHFQIIWGNDDQTGLINDTFIKLNLDQLEKYREIYTTELGMNDSSESVFTPDGKKYKTNIYLTRTGLPDFEEGWAYMSAEPFTGFAYIFCDPAAMTQLDGTDSASLPHEYGHVLTYHSKGWTDQTITGPWWEAVANWFKEQYFDTLETPTTHFFLPYLRNMNLTIPHGRMYYEAWIFLQYLSENPDNFDALGKDFIMRLQTEAKPNEYPFDTIERISGCDMKDLIGSFAKHMATLDFKHKELYNEALSKSLEDPFVWQLIYTQPEPAPDKENCYIVPEEKAPMQTGLNVIPLNIEGRRVSVTLRGISDAEEADWRACLVTEKKDGTTYYSSLFSEGTKTIALDGTETALYLTVAATPDEIIPNNLYDKAENGDEYSYNKSDYKRRYPYEFDIKGASPMYRDIKKSIEGHNHPNGGGFVADTVEIDDTVYVGQDAMVLGNSVIRDKVVITDHAVVNNAEISDNARISDYACVYGFWWATPTISGNAKIGENAVVTAGASVSGNARVMGNAYLLDEYSVTDNATVKGTAYCYGKGVASGEAILDGDFYNECSVSHGAAFGWQESEEYNKKLPYTDGLYAGYEFDRNSNVFAYDTYGATNGIIRNAPLWQEKRASADGVITFNGTNQYIICDKTLVDYKNMEICTSILWRGGKADQRVFDFGNGTSMYFTPANKNGRPEFGIGDSKITSRTEFEQGKWYIVRVIISDNTAKLLINGQVIGSTKITTLPEQTFSPLTRCYIARSHAGDYFNGSMDYFRVYFHEAEQPEYYYTGKEIIFDEPTLLGDANCDGIVDDDDVSLIMRAVAFPSSYGVNGSNLSHITVQGLSNADVYEPGGGLTNQDARSISRFIEGVIKSLPES